MKPCVSSTYHATPVFRGDFAHALELHTLSLPDHTLLPSLCTLTHADARCLPRAPPHARRHRCIRITKRWEKPCRRYKILLKQLAETASDCGTRVGLNDGSSTPFNIRARRCLFHTGVKRNHRDVSAGFNQRGERTWVVSKA